MIAYLYFKYIFFMWEIIKKPMFGSKNLRENAKGEK